jgi:hypothetical protein|tara:strand:+ start:20252 stop:20929 length:678 start_codon:yes stop_codon:yes gene_type:complete
LGYKNYSDWFGVEGFSANFSFNEKDYSILSHRRDFASLLDYDQNALVIPKQVHSKNVYYVDSPGLLEETDGVFSDKKEIVLTIQVADCIPLFLMDVKTERWGLIHSGWQGTAKNIAGEAIDQFQKSRSNPGYIKAVLGPSIGQCCFEVGREVSDQFDIAFSIPGKGNRKMVDLRGVLKSQLTEVGVSQANILIDDDCTFCQDDLYFSYRREGDKAGRMVAIAGWR